MSAYYNENDPRAAAWLRELIREGWIAPGVVDDRPIQEVRARDFEDYAQCHFFAGIGGWSFALRLAGIADDEPIWTGSCPCQPFSAAGQRRGKRDPRHLWPEFCRLVADGRAATVFGEQVASKDGRRWLAGVRADLAALGYATGAADLCAAGAGEEGEGWILRGDVGRWERIVIGAPHLRQRLYWMAHADGGEPRNGGIQCGGEHGFEPAHGGARRLADAHGDRCAEHERESRQRRDAGPTHAAERGGAGGVGHAVPSGLSPSEPEDLQRSGRWEERRAARQSSLSRFGMGDSERRGGIRTPHCGPIEASERWVANAGAWGAFDILPCTYGKARRVESGTFPLAHGVPGRVGLLRGYGNAIVPQVAVQFILAAREALAPL